MASGSDWAAAAWSGMASQSTKGSTAKERRSRFEEQPISLKEKLYDIHHSYDVFSVAKPKRGSHLEVGDELYSSKQANEKQLKGWKLQDGSKVDVSSNVKITNIKEHPTTIDITGKITIGTRKGASERTVTKRFNKRDRFMVAMK